ncbi:hypothetical protein B296_00033962 [Ensete ventricosum]|uniref:Uncharacterized protein n=1 Tax=Ensete ventricosum TaxID=4639 RepID=A0A426YLK4_ENSVE|nr:hypothetical protein B296_00033962 [Ensete ventricosum]
MSTESFELAIPLTSVSFAQLFQSLRNTSHFALSHLSPRAPLVLSTVKFGCQHRAVARTQPSQSLCATHFLLRLLVLVVPFAPRVDHTFECQT